MPKGDAAVVVVGGGVGGMTAAVALGDVGLDVVLVEKAAELGGHAADWACMATDLCARCSACTVQDQVAKVVQHPRIEALLGAVVENVTGVPGAFRVRVVPAAGAVAGARRGPGTSCTGPVDLGAKRVLLATGFTAYDPGASPLLSHGRLPEVFTTVDLDRVLRKDALEEFLPAGLDQPRIAFLQCVGSRDRQRGRGYCSQFCCKATVRMASRLMHLRPDACITVYYIDLQIMGKAFRAFHEKVRGKVRFLQGVPDQVDHGWDDDRDHVVLRSRHPETGEPTAEVFDRVVLSVGMTARADEKDVEDVFGVGRDAFGFIARAGQRRTGTSREGIDVVGAAAGPTDIQGTRTQALAAAAVMARELGALGPAARAAK